MADDRPRIYHNPRCSKSRETLQILEQQDTAPEIVEYLQTPPDADELRQIIALLGVPARELLRDGEDAYREAGLDAKDLDDEEVVIKAILDYPILLQRPIVISAGRAVIGRPPSRVLDIIG